MTDGTTPTGAAHADVAVVGAGPAGLSAAVVAAEHGLSVVLIDAARQTGGQYWRHPDERHRDSFAAPESTGHHHWTHYTDLRVASLHRWPRDASGTSRADRCGAPTASTTVSHCAPARSAAPTPCLSPSGRPGRGDS